MGLSGEACSILYPGSEVCFTHWRPTGILVVPSCVQAQRYILYPEFVAHFVSWLLVYFIFSLWGAICVEVYFVQRCRVHFILDLRGAIGTPGSEVQSLLARRYILCSGSVVILFQAQRLSMCICVCLDPVFVCLYVYVPVCVCLSICLYMYSK